MASLTPDDELDVLKRRLEALEARRATLAARAMASPSRAFVGVVADGGALPATAPNCFLMAPQAVGGVEAEGRPVALAAAGPPIPVEMLGPRVPAVGDALIVRQPGDRWVARRGGGAPEDPTKLPCVPCAIPRHDLRLRLNLFVGTNSGDPGSYLPADMPLPYVGPPIGPYWMTGGFQLPFPWRAFDPFGVGAGISYFQCQLYCDAGVSRLRAYQYDSAAQLAAGAWARTLTFSLPEESSCTPFDVTYQGSIADLDHFSSGRVTEP